MCSQGTPISLYLSNGELFRVITSHKFYNFVSSPVFSVKKIDKETGCIILSPFIPIDMEGCPVDLGPELYSLLETDSCVTLKLDCICGVLPLSACLINRYIPIIEPKC
jgi:hypothetical protein